MGIALKSDGKNCDYGTAFYFNSLAPSPQKKKQNKNNTQQTSKQTKKTDRLLAK